MAADLHPVRQAAWPKRAVHCPAPGRQAGAEVEDYCHCRCRSHCLDPARRVGAEAGVEDYCHFRSHCLDPAHRVGAVAGVEDYCHCLYLGSDCRAEAGVAAEDEVVRHGLRDRRRDRWGQTDQW